MSLATRIAVMDEGTNVGASTPIDGSGADIGGALGKKILNDTRAFMRSIAADRDRNPEQAERFVSEALSLTADEALASGVIDIVVPSDEDLMDHLEGREIAFRGRPLTLRAAGTEPVRVAPRPKDVLLSYVARPQIAHLLMSAGTLAIFVELLSPGLIAPGVFGPQEPAEIDVLDGTARSRQFVALPRRTSPDAVARLAADLACADGQAPLMAAG